MRIVEYPLRVFQIGDHFGKIRFRKRMLHHSGCLMPITTKIEAILLTHAPRRTNLCLFIILKADEN